MESLQVKVITFVLLNMAVGHFLPTGQHKGAFTFSKKPHFSLVRQDVWCIGKASGWGSEPIYMYDKHKIRI